MAAALHPCIPHDSYLSHGCRPGYLLHVDGKVPVQANGFAINLVTAQGDIALHFNPRFGENVIVMNTMVRGSWQAEQRVNTCLLGAGRDFELKIMVEQHGFMIALNGCHLCMFSHRMPFESITRANVTGDVKLKFLYHTTGYAPAPIKNPAVPLTVEIPGGFVPGRKVMVYGKAVHEFSINLQCGSIPFQQTGLHINPRFSQNCFVLNDCTYQQWGQEERPNLKIGIHDDFTIEVECQPSWYELRVNGCTYKFGHRNTHIRAVHTVNTLFITGSVKIHDVFFG